MADRISLEKQIAEAAREIALRRNVYPQRVGAGKMRQAEADLLIANMEAILETLKWVRDNADTIRKVYAAARQYEYTCAICQTHDPDAYQRCQRAGCLDGRDQ